MPTDPAEQRELIHIGTSEVVSFPDDQIYDVPAKIDTGADSSSVWASNIRMQDGELSFNFFAPGYVLYNPEPVVTAAFRTTTVKNSFGHEEFRYKVKLQVQIGEHTLERWFSLADRSRNTYPILLGKSFLKNRFVVDVSRRHIISNEPGLAKILVLGAAKSGDFFTSVQASNKMNVTYDCIGYQPLMYCIAGQQTKVMNMDQGIDIADYALTYFKSHNRHSESAAAAAEYLRYKGRNFIDREVASYTSMSKLTEYMKLACHGLEVPAAICAHTPLLAESYELIVERLGLPFVLKEMSADRGRDNYLVGSQTDFEQILQQAPKQHIYIAQRYIENEGFLRLYVLGRDVSMAIWRGTHPHKDKLRTHLNKPAGGANAETLPLSEVPMEVQAMAISAANCMERQIAGVDLIQDKHTHKWYILEVNNAPQIRSGSFVDAKSQAVARYIDKELNR